MVKQQENPDFASALAFLGLLMSLLSPPLLDKRTRCFVSTTRGKVVATVRKTMANTIGRIHSTILLWQFANTNTNKLAIVHKPMKNADGWTLSIILCWQVNVTYKQLNNFYVLFLHINFRYNWKSFVPVSSRVTHTKVIG